MYKNIAKLYLPWCLLSSNLDAHDGFTQIFTGNAAYYKIYITNFFHMGGTMIVFSTPSMTRGAAGLAALVSYSALWYECSLFLHGVNRAKSG